MKIDKELMKGSTTIIILGLLKETAMYGYQMIKEIEQKSKGLFSFKEGTLYPLLHSLESNGYIEAYWEQSNEGRKRKYYRITKEGIRYFERKKAEWESYKTAVDSCLTEVNLWA